MFDRFECRNFKSLAGVRLDLSPLTVLVGPNGAGKSSVLEAMRLAASIGRKDRLLHGVSGLSRVAADPSEPVRLAMRSVGGDELRLGVVHGLPVRFAVALVAPTGVETELVTFDRVSLDALHTPRLDVFGPAAFLRLELSNLAAVSIPDEQPGLAEDGSGLASTLAWLKGAREEEFAQLVADLAAVVPGVTKIRTYREKVTARRMDRIEVDGSPMWRPVDETELGDRFEVEFSDGRSVPADLLSEGTLMALGLMTVLRVRGGAKLVLLDDLDRGLHIEAQARLVDALRGMMARDPELQIVCTTHSPYLLDRFDAGEVRVLALDEHRRTHARSLADHPDFEAWRFGLQTGELWASLGDAWVTGDP